MGEDSTADRPRILARTVIQPDADVITFVSDGLLTDPSALQRHLEQVARRFRSIRLVRVTLRRLWALILVPLTWGAYNSATGDIVHIVVGFSSTTIPFIIRPLIIQLTGRYLLRRLGTAAG